MWEVLIGDAVVHLRAMPAGIAQTCITSPPYWRQRQYTDGNLLEAGLERTLSEYVANLVEVFRAVRRVLTDDGTLMINLGDCWNGTGRAGGDYRPGCKREGQRPPPGRWDKAFKKKDLTLTPHAVAQALRDDGWYLRQEIIWSKGWASPGSAVDRPVTTHEQVFLLAKSPRYTTYGANAYGSVWEFPTNRGAAGHHAAMPLDLAERCVSITTQSGDLVIDPFAGTGTTGVAALAMGRKCTLIELSDEHAATAIQRCVGWASPPDKGKRPSQRQLNLLVGGPDVG
jgi:site-specific DNA-methyltransferase (cytosine-N4-specific)